MALRTNILDFDWTEEQFEALTPELKNLYQISDDLTYEDWNRSRMSDEDLLAEAQEDYLATDVMKPVYDDTGRIIGWNATGDINDPLEKDYSSLWDQLDEAKETDIPGLDDWMTEQGYDFYDPMAREASTYDPDTGEEIFGDFTNKTMQDVQALIDQLTSGPTAMELSDAQAYAAQLMGIDPADYQSIVGGLLERGTADPYSLDVMSQEERDLRERINRNELRQMEERAGRFIDNIMASTGSASRSYAAADQAIQKINNQQLAMQLEISNEEIRRQERAQETSFDQWERMVAAGTMSQGEYLRLLNESKSMAFEGYALQVNTMMLKNQQYLQEYTADLNAIGMSIDSIYAAINMEIGIDEKAMRDIERQYQMELAPIIAQMDIALTNIQLAEAEASTFNLFQFLAGAGILAISPLFGPVIGAGVAAGGVTTIGGSF